ncbi:MAG TPA: hypothetical protein PLR88_06995 [Bacteroidales bacterium]|nr:hypothetical protein [Bacteroidales bacterium]
MNDSIKVVLKQKNISAFVDFCLEEKIEFNVRPQAYPDNDWEFNMMVKDIKTAVLTGMFLRENRIDIADGEMQQKSKKSSSSRKSRDEKEDEEEDKSQVAASSEEPASDIVQEESDAKGLF